ncbi:unnamed protein product [Phyllotreta striolata]|uniref:2-(3-amino-3-carboxypropyl)histidine synthase n=1 Tax=Phyllotreta striolata TaxID=444603 RepID=A0A9N9TIH7_PHYSR|nr:unnamed protein product [Phyllotreta striolata]
MTKLTFSSNEAVSLEKQVDLLCTPIETKPEDLEAVYEISRCAEWIRSNNFKKVCLQFPDHLLADSSEVILRLQGILNQTVYLLGDTAYESCCIDYIAAAHIDADAIIHFGPVCFSKTSASLPYINIYEKKSLDLEKLRAQFEEKFNDEQYEIVILVDTIYLHLFDALEKVFRDLCNVSLQRIDAIECNQTFNCLCFLSDNDRKLLNVALNFKPKILYYYDGNIKVFENASKVVKRRNFIIEKIKDSETVGIIIGTLGVKNYLEILARTKTLISNSGKKYYLISVGKPTVAKLANFPELDIYVVITCSMNEIYESRDFYKPIATPFDIEIALNRNADSISDFTYDYNAFLGNTEIASNTEAVGDVSLLTNKLRVPVTTEEIKDPEDTTVAVKDAGTIALSNSGAGYLAQRSWQGLEQNLGRTEPHLAKEGRDGIPLHYRNEEHQ